MPGDFRGRSRNGIKGSFLEHLPWQEGGSSQDPWLALLVESERSEWQHLLERDHVRPPSLQRPRGGTTGSLLPLVAHQSGHNTCLWLESQVTAPKLGKEGSKQDTRLPSLSNFCLSMLGQSPQEGPDLRKSLILLVVWQKTTPCSVAS